MSKWILFLNGSEVKCRTGTGGSDCTLTEGLFPVACQNILKLRMRRHSAEQTALCHHGSQADFRRCSEGSHYPQLQPAPKISGVSFCFAENSPTWILNKKLAFNSKCVASSFVLIIISGRRKSIPESKVSQAATPQTGTLRGYNDSQSLRITKNNSLMREALRKSCLSHSSLSKLTG